jgi:prolyl oligopeptidase
VNLTPGFAAWVGPFLERGGVYAVANLRGGGEYGEAWHQAGMLGNKQNVFDDFAAAAEYLVREKITLPEHLAISGRSNGGLLVAAAITQHPKLFKAAVCGVPLTDMVRYHSLQIARLWIPEYGSPENPEDFARLFAYSPYHHVKDGTAYPATLIFSAEADSRVDPMHARKFAARLQAATSSDAPILLRLEGKAGHGAGKPLTKIIAQYTDELSFLFAELGVQAPQPSPSERK